MRKTLLAVVLALSSTLTMTSVRAADELLIGTLFPLTGPGAVTGNEQQYGVDLAIKHINAKGGVNGRMLKAVIEDSIGRPDQAVLSFNRMVELNHVPVVMSAYSSVALAIDPLATRNKVLVINSGAQADALGSAGPFMVNTIPLIRDEAGVLAQFAIQKLGKTAATMYESGAAGQAGRDDFKQAFEALGGKVVADEPTEFGQTNFRPALLKIKAAKPDMVYIAVTQNFAVIAEQISQIPDFPKVIGNTYSTPFFGNPGAVGWYNTSVVSKTPPALAEEYKKQFKKESFEIQAREYYNSVHLIAKAMKQVLDQGKDVTGENIRAAIFEIGTFNSDIAEISFKGGQTAKRPVIIEQNGAKERTTIDFIAK